MSVFSSWLFSQIKANGWDQNDFAVKLRVGESLVSKWLKNGVKPSRRMVLRMANLFNVPTDYIMEMIDPEDVIKMLPEPERNAKRIEILSRLDSFADIIDTVAAMPLEKQSFYIELIRKLLPDLRDPVSNGQGSN